MSYFINRNKEHMIDWSTFIDAGHCFVSDTDNRNVKLGIYIKIIKETDEVIFVNNEESKRIWTNSELVIDAPLLINI